MRVEQRIETTKPRMKFTNHQRARGNSHCLCFCFGFFVAVVFSTSVLVPSRNKWLAANTVALSSYHVSPGCANEYNQLEGFLAFLNMSARYNLRLKKFDKVPAFSSLDTYVWETHPKTIYMPSNSHMTWYTDNANERKLITVMRWVLEHSEATEGLVVDLGINDGYIAALGAAYGYRVLAIDAQPECVRRFNLAKAFNDWKEVQVLNKIVMNEEKVMTVANGICGGGSRYQGTQAKLIRKKGVTVAGIGGYTDVSSARLDDLVSEEKNILFLHLDVEGAELSVLSSARHLIEKRRIMYIVWEFAPHRWKRNRSQSIELVEKFMASFTCADIREMSRVSSRRDLFHAVASIDDWKSFYATCEKNRVITDVMCRNKRS